MAQNMMDKKKVLLGLSGGVDSTAAALLLLGKGYEVTGLFLDVLGDRPEEAARAEKAAKELGISFIYKNVSAGFEDKVINYFCRSYGSGETPNPCIFCNPTLKFDTLLKEADKSRIHWVATGHYARTQAEPETGVTFLYKGASKAKDQSYMLYRLEQHVLMRLLLPLGEISSKETVREYLKEKKMSNAGVRDSQEICFIKKGEDYSSFLKKRGIPDMPGEFIDVDGNVIGRHKGMIHYTLGQRKGLGMTFGKPMFVVGLDSDRNQVVLGPNEQLFKDEVLVNNLIFTGFSQGDGALCQALDKKAVEAKIRYAAPPSAGTLHFMSTDQVLIRFKEPQRAPTPGQSVVFYIGDRLIGGGIISRS